MPRATKSRSKVNETSTGSLAEAKLAQVWFWEGSFVRFGVNLKRHFGEDSVQLTDLDLLAYSFGPGLRMTKLIGECKSGRDAKPLDRLVWLKGLAEVTGADGAELTTAIAPPPKVRRLADGLGVAVQSIGDLKIREERLRISEVANSGSHGEDMPALIDEFRKACSSDPELERAFWYFRSDAWLVDSWTAVRAALSAVRLLSPKWAVGVDDSVQRSLRFVLCEAVLQFIWGLTGLARIAVRMNEVDFASVATEMLTHGDIPAAQAKRTAAAVDKYVVGVLQAHGVPRDKIVDALGAFEPMPPTYLEPLLELVRRVVNEETTARHVLRYADLLLFERVVRARDVSQRIIARLDLNADEAGRLTRVYVAFLCGQASLPQDFMATFAADTTNSQTQAGQAGQQKLEGLY